MQYLEGIITTTHLDLEDERMDITTLESLVKQINASYLPVTWGHDPRIPPIGRFISASLEELEDGEFAVVGVSEIFEEGDEIELKDETREIPIEEFNVPNLYIGYDRSYLEPSDQQLLEEMKEVVNGELGPQLKKSLEPVSVLILTISGFVIGQIFNGFLNKMGSDTFDFFKKKMKELFIRKREEKIEHLLQIQIIVRRENHSLSVETVLTNPTDQELDSFLSMGLKEFDRLLPQYCKSNPNLRRIVFEYGDEGLHFSYGVRKDAVPILGSELQQNVTLPHEAQGEEKRDHLSESVEEESNIAEGINAEA